MSAGTKTNYTPVSKYPPLILWIVDNRTIHLADAFSLGENKLKMHKTWNKGSANMGNRVLET